MKKLILILMLLTSFVFNSQKAFAGGKTEVSNSSPAPVVNPPPQRAVATNGDTVAIREIIKEKDLCEKCEDSVKITWSDLIWIVLMFLVISILLR